MFFLAATGTEVQVFNFTQRLKSQTQEQVITVMVTVILTQKVEAQIAKSQVDVNKTEVESVQL